MKTLNLTLTLICLITVVVSTNLTQQKQEKQELKNFDNSKGWTSEQAAEHADRYNNVEFWKHEQMAMDAKDIEKPLSASRAAMPFPYVAFNTPEYKFDGLTIGPIDLPKPLAGVGASVNFPIEGEVPKGKTFFDVVKTEPVMHVVAKGAIEFEKADSWGISRSYPHLLFQGFFSNKHGNIDWTAIRMADGKEVGVINGRILDLSQGNLIFVRQLEDGSVRIFQHRTRLRSGKLNEIATTIGKNLSEKFAREFLEIK